MCLNPNGIKIYDINHNFFWQVCFSILEEKNWKFNFQKWPFYAHFWSFFGTYISIFHKTEIQTGILRCLVCKNCSWIKSYNTMLVKIFFFHAWKCINLPKGVLTPKKKTSSCVFKMGMLLFAALQCCSVVPCWWSWAGNRCYSSIVMTSLGWCLLQAPSSKNIEGPTKSHWWAILLLYFHFMHLG